MRDADRVDDYDFLLGKEVIFNTKKYTIDGTWRVFETGALYIALKDKGGWLNIPAPQVIKAYFNERTFTIS